MYEIAIVKKILPNQLAVVVNDSNEGCEMGCDGCRGCSNVVQAEITASNTIGAKEGDTVYIETDENKKAMLFFIIFFLPIILPVLLYVAGLALRLPTMANGGMAVFGVLISVFIIRYFNKKAESELPPTKIISIQ